MWNILNKKYNSTESINSIDKMDNLSRPESRNFRRNSSRVTSFRPGRFAYLKRPYSYIRMEASALEGKRAETPNSTVIGVILVMYLFYYYF